MRRYRVKKAQVGVSLFPFLAVLICTMGSLIVLLVMVVQMARVDASDQVDPVASGQPMDELEMEHATSQWRRDLLEDQLKQVKVDLADNRLALSHLEQHIRELEQQWKSLRSQAADIRLRLRGDAGDEQAIDQQLAETEAAIAETQAALEAARNQAARRPPAYCIVPYDGPHGTKRRPIYLECTSQGVTIQPEGILLAPADFGGALGPGNPLDAALRAIREYYVRAAPQGSHAEPYPLLIVRPDGAEAYALARSALRVWDNEFGYELVDESMELEFPPENAQLAEVMQHAIRDARSRQRALAAAMPSRFEPQQDVGVVASSAQGGFMPLPGSDTQRWATRRGGFGAGGNRNYLDGRAEDVPAAGESSAQQPPSEPQSVDGTTQPGHADGLRGAEFGEGVSPLAKTRGRNWGLPGDSEHATGVTRPLRLACLPDRFILLPEQGTTQLPQIVMINDDLRGSIDELVAKIWDRIDLWGIAVTGGYWKPVLVIDVAQGADQRFRDLQTLLMGSGLEVKRRSP